MKRGFTLIELLAVVLIMGILTAIALPQYRRSLERSRVAEALQMLPAIFDARDRLLIERGWTLPANSGNLSFSKLDIDMKGQAVSNTQWQTENFSYNLDNRCIGTACALTTSYVSATFLRGLYRGTTLYYRNGSMSCCPGSVTDACERLNIQQAVCGISVNPFPSVGE